MQKGIVDRIEGETAVVECNEKIVDIPLTRLPKDVKAGDVLVFQEDGSYTISEEDTKDRKETIKKLMNELWEG
jgi:Protein of unknown function (DUF3006)